MTLNLYLPSMNWESYVALIADSCHCCDCGHRDPLCTLAVSCIFISPSLSSPHHLHIVWLSSSTITQCASILCYMVSSNRTQLKGFEFFISIPNFDTLDVMWELGLFNVTNILKFQLVQSPMCTIHVTFPRIVYSLMKSNNSSWSRAFHHVDLFS